jgi:hypothetical protein
MNDDPATPSAPEPAVDSHAVELPAVPGAAAPSFDGHAAEPPADPLEPVKVLAAERPELVVGAAFAGGILAAMILRRLGN